MGNKLSGSIPSILSLFERARRKLINFAPRKRKAVGASTQAQVMGEEIRVSS
jgi:hypothetical protein